MKNLLFKNFGVFLNTKDEEQYEINNVVIFQDNKEKIIANNFIENFKNYQFEINGDIKRKLKKDLTAKINFVVKSEKQDNWNGKTQYTLYINGDLNHYKFEKLELLGCGQLVAKYYINSINCNQCIGWNHKESNMAKYTDFKEAYKKIELYTIDNENMEKYIQDLQKAYKKYKKAIEKEKTYTAEDYKKMQLVSGTTYEENITMLKNNGFDVQGIKKEN